MTKPLHKHIGILGGTFDPVHIAHLRLAIDLKESTNLEQIRLVPNFIPPHKSNKTTDIEHRLNMLNLATKNLKNIIIDTTEIEIAEQKIKNNKNYKSYMIDTLEVLNKKFTALYQDNYTLWLVLGADSFRNFDTWYNWQDILNQTNFLILKRDYQEINFHNDWADSVKDKITLQKETSEFSLLPKNKSGYILFKNSRQLDISATEIRNLISSKKSADFLITKEVYEYITNNNLY